MQQIFLYKRYITQKCQTLHIDKRPGFNNL